MQRHSKIKSVSIAAVAAFGLFAGLPGSASAGGLKIDINLGGGPPRHHEEVVVLEYDSYCVGYRRNLYDADWRLRNAQVEQWHAQEALEDARHREGDVALVCEDNESFVAEYEKRVLDSDAAVAAARAAVGRAADDAADARARLHAFEKRIKGAHEDLEAARTLRDGAAVVDAEKRIRLNEEAAAVAAADLRAAEGRLVGLQSAEAGAAELSDARLKLVDARARLPRLREDLAVAHDAVFGAQQRLDAAIGAVALALHDRDEAMWFLHRDEILTGRATFASCGFAIDLGVWGGRMPRDPEVVHAYFVHPVAFWVERPVEIQTRVIEFERVTEVARIRTIQERHEGPRFREVVRFEASVPVERRREFAQRVVVEREHLVAERTEREHAAAEHRAPRIPESVRAEAKANVIKARAEGRSELVKAHADAKAEKIEAHGQAQAEITKAKADAKAEKIEAHGEAKAEETKARADARAKETEAKSARNSRDPRGASANDPGNSRASRDNKDPKKKDKNGNTQANSEPNR